MSPHQRVLTAAALTLKSRRIRSARAAAAGSALDHPKPPARLLFPPPQDGQLLAFGTGQPAVTARAAVPFGLAHPLADRGLGQVEVPGDLPDRAVTALAQLDDLGLELGCERPAHPRLSAFRGLHDGHPPRGSTPDGGCPSKRVRPTFRTCG